MAPGRKRQNHPQPEPAEVANSIDYGLSTALYTRDVNRAFAAMRDLEAGITYINAHTIGAEVHLTFGGVKHTGNGHREGLGALGFFTTWKAVYVDYSEKLQRADRQCGVRNGIRELLPFRRSKCILEKYTHGELLD